MLINVESEAEIRLLNEVAGRIWVLRDLTVRKSLEADEDTLVVEPL